MSLSKLAKKTAQTAKNIGETLRTAFRGKITLVVSSEPIQRVQLSGLADETLQDLEHLQEYGFASHPPDGSEAVVIPLGGNTSHGVIVCSQHGSYRIKNLKPGETAIFNHEGLSKAKSLRPIATCTGLTANNTRLMRPRMPNLTLRWWRPVQC